MVCKACRGFPLAYSSREWVIQFIFLKILVPFVLSLNDPETSTQVFRNGSAKSNKLICDMLALCDKFYCLLRMEYPEYCCLLPVDNLLNVHEMHCFSFSLDLYIFNKFSCHSLCVLIHSLSSNRSQHYISLTNKCYLSYFLNPLLC